MDRWLRHCSTGLFTQAKTQLIRLVRLRWLACAAIVPVVAAGCVASATGNRWRPLLKPTDLKMIAAAPHGAIYVDPTWVDGADSVVFTRDESEGSPKYALYALRIGK